MIETKIDALKKAKTDRDREVPVQSDPEELEEIVVTPTGMEGLSDA